MSTEESETASQIVEKAFDAMLFEGDRQGIAPESLVRHTFIQSIQIFTCIARFKGYSRPKEIESALWERLNTEIPNVIEASLDNYDKVHEMLKNPQ